MILSGVVFAMLALTRCHYLIEDSGTAWLFGWYAKDACIAALVAYAAVVTPITKPTTKSALVLAFIWEACDLALEVSGLSLADGVYIFAAPAVAFLAWIAKQYLIRPVTSDPLTTDRYMYALAPILGITGVLNEARPNVFAQYAGRVIVSGDFVYCLHRRKFVRLPRERVSLDGYSLIDTGEALNEKTTTSLDGRIGKTGVVLFNDCATLRTAEDLNTILFRRYMRKAARCLTGLFGRK